MKNSLEGFKINEDLEDNSNTSIISFHDLLACEEFRDAHEREDVATVEQLLHSVGVDLTWGYYPVSRLHRPLSSSKVVFGVVLIYIERLDKEWLESGAASINAHIKSTKDKSVRAEMMYMQDAYLGLDKIETIYKGK